MKGGFGWRWQGKCDAVIVDFFRIICDSRPILQPAGGNITSSERTSTECYIFKCRSECCLAQDVFVLIHMNTATRDPNLVSSNEKTCEEKSRPHSGGKSTTKCVNVCVTCYFLGAARCPSAKRSRPTETSWACTRWAHLLQPSPASGSSVGCERNLGQRLRQEQHIKASVCKSLTSLFLKIISDYVSDIKNSHLK